jgi:C4-dicarboxylate-specific signal transduction histidine kinase
MITPLPDSFRRYAAAIAIVVGAFFLKLLIQEFTGINHHPLLVLEFAAVIASAWVGGLGPGILAVALSTFLVDYLFIPPRYAFNGDIRVLPWFIEFIGCAIVGAFLSARQREAREALQKAHDDLEEKVHQRTRELEKVNAKLSSEAIERERAEEALHQLSAEHARVSRLTTMGEFVASISHEITQPLASIEANASASLRWLSNNPSNRAEAEAAILRILRDGHHAREIVEQIRSLLRKTDSQRRIMDIGAAVHEMLPLIDGELKRRGITVQIAMSKTPPVMADRIEFQQVMLNLALNSLEAMQTIDRKHQLSIRSQPAPSGGILVMFEDTGCGVGPNQVDRIFDPLFSTKSSGMGLGLSICRSIIERHGGKIWIHQSSPEGTVIHFTLPATAVPAGRPGVG